MDLITALQLQLDPAQPEVVALVGGGGKSSTLFRLAHEVVQAGHRALITTTTRLSPAQIDWFPAHVLVTEEQLPLALIEQALDQHGQCLLVSQITAEKVIGLPPQVVDQLVAAAPALRVALIGVEADGAKMLPTKAPADYEPVLPTTTTLLVPVMGIDAIGEPIDEAHVHRPERVRQLLGLADDQVLPRLTPAQAAHLLSSPHGGAKARPTGARLLPLLNKAESTPHLAAARLTAQCLLAANQPCLIGAVGIEQSTFRLPNSAFRPPILERWGPITTVVLAAGQSRRMGSPKQLVVVDGEPMVVRAVRVALQSRATRVLVVTGAYAEAVGDLLSPWLPSAAQLQLVHNPAYATGQASSIRTAVQALGADCLGAIFLPVDQPFVPPHLLQRLIQAWRQGARLVATAVAGQVRGAPALFDRTLWPDLLALQGDIGARPLLQHYGAELVTVPAHLADLRDLDTPEDLAHG